MRLDHRNYDQLRGINFTPHAAEFAEGSCLVEFGKTKVLCTASYEAQAPKWLQGTGQGWITAEYGMLPRSTQTRIKRDKAATGGRTQEISRLIGRSLRAAVDLKALNEKQITIDCDVLHADGGTRTACITGGFVALALALKKLQDLSEIKSLGLVQYVSAISVGLQKKGNESLYLLDLNYDEDSTVGTDMNFVMTNKAEFIELQGTAEQTPFKKDDLDKMLLLAQAGCYQLFKKQSEIIGSFFPLS